VRAGPRSAFPNRVRAEQPSSAPGALVRGRWWRRPTTWGCAQGPRRRRARPHAKMACGEPPCGQGKNPRRVEEAPRLDRCHAHRAKLQTPPAPRMQGGQEHERGARRTVRGVRLHAGFRPQGLARACARRSVDATAKGLGGGRCQRGRQGKLPGPTPRSRALVDGHAPSGEETATADWRHRQGLLTPRGGLCQDPHDKYNSRRGSMWPAWSWHGRAAAGAAAGDALRGGQRPAGGAPIMLWGAKI